MDNLNETKWLDSLSRKLGGITGVGLGGQAFAGITWATLIVSMFVLGAAAICHLVLRNLARRQIRNARARVEGSEPERAHQHWLAASLETAVRPLGLVIWACGVPTALTPLFNSPQPGTGEGLLRAALLWLRDLGAAAAVIWFLWRWTRVVEGLLKALAARTTSKWDYILATLAGRALRLVLPLLGLILVLPMVDISWASHEFFRQGLSLLLIAAIAAILFQMLGVLEQAVLSQFRLDVRDNLHARRIHTQVRVLKRVASAGIAVFTLASMLMVFDSVRHLGTSLLASAGIVGIVVGFAAQRSLSLLMAGFQIAITQPIRLDDVVIVENEWGWIEEFTLTYVVVRIWDLRRLIVPITYFIEKPFQNWTRVSADLLGSVFLHVDYTVPMAALRQEFDRVVENSKLWDRKVKALQVTDAKEHALEVRALVSAADSSAAWALRCEVREKLVDFLQRNYPQCLPRTRADLRQAVPSAAGRGAVSKRAGDFTDGERGHGRHRQERVERNGGKRNM